MRANGQVIGPPYDVDVPTALWLDFDGRPVWFVAGTPQFQEPHDAFIPGDAIVIVFAASKIRQMGYADPNFCRVGPQTMDRPAGTDLRASNRLIEKVEDRALDRPSQSLGQRLHLLPRLLRKTNLPVRHEFPRPRRAARA
ncbi:hypothetical protein [Dactylosporangium sp. CA-092794]|uniref:hypothetical protein n=1 Tax=Dactylosporangium sp. CA-092794 TaxID=3239929 RepID=UPI003D8F7161